MSRLQYDRPLSRRPLSTIQLSFAFAVWITCPLRQARREEELSSDFLTASGENAISGRSVSTQMGKPTAMENTDSPRIVAVLTNQFDEIRARDASTTIENL